MTSGMRILVVDDSLPLREFVVQALAGREGFVAVEAPDGAAALKMTLADPPDLILLDLELPRLSGFQVLDALRARQAHVPIILMTSHGSEAIAVEVFRKGVRDYLIKPFTAEEMYDAIDRALTEVRLRREKEDLTRHLAGTNRQLRMRVRELDTLYRVGKSVTSLLSRDQLLERILDAAFYVISAEEAALMLADEETGRLQTEIYRQRVPGQVHHLARRTAEELAADAARKGDATASGAMLYAPLKVGGRAIGALGVSNRVTVRPFSEHDRRLLTALADYAAIAIENARLYENLRQADQAKSEFVSLVAHELRTPMTSIRGYTDMLQKGAVGPLSPRQLEFLSIVHSNVERMQVLVSDLLDISRIETGRLLLEIRPTILTEALEEALQSTQGQIESRSQRLKVEVPESLPRVLADPARLAQILVNLLSNAHKYTPDGGHIQVRAWWQDGYVHCVVSDTGIGMSVEDQARLFTKFFRSEHPAVRERSGTGLGLCIVKSLVELHGGQIGVQSAPGQGTAITFTMPVAKEVSRSAGESL
jgi:signal transduction histidine kinase/DNA-binding response OmpR family regulator